MRDPIDDNGSFYILSASYESEALFYIVDINKEPTRPILSFLCIFSGPYTTWREAYKAYQRIDMDKLNKARVK